MIEPVQLYHQDGRFFQLAEFASPDTGQIVVNRFLLEQLDTLRERFGSAITVTSGYRTREHNAHVGGAAKSEHLYGRAADIVPTHGDLEAFRRLTQLAVDIDPPGLGVYLEQHWKPGRRWLHIDVRAFGRGARWAYLDGVPAAYPLALQRLRITPPPDPED